MSAATALNRDRARAALRTLDRAGKLAVTPDHVVAGLMRHAGMPPIAGGDRTLDATLTKANDEIAELEKEAATKWTAYEAAKKAFLESGASPTDTSSDEFKTLDAAGKEHDGIADKIADAKSARERIQQMVATEKGRASAPGAHVPASPELVEHARKMIREVGKAIAAGAEWKAARDSGVFTSTGDIGRIALGKGWDRDELKALITSGPAGAGPFIEPDRVGYFPNLNRPLTIAELVTVGDTDSDLVQYVRQVLQGHNVGVQQNQGDPKPESAYSFELVDEGVKTLAHWVPAAKQALADAGQLRTIIDGQLRDGLGQYLENEMVAGPGTNGRLLGIINTPGVLSPVVTAAMSLLDRVHRGITAIRMTNQEPTAVGFHPEDWEQIRLAREEVAGEGTATGGYLMGSPITSGQGVTVWGLQPAVSTAFPKGTAVVGRYAAAVLWLREAAQILASDSHSDYFTRNLIAVLAEMRAAFGLPRPDAFAEVNLGAVA